MGEEIPAQGIIRASSEGYLPLGFDVTAQDEEQLSCYSSSSWEGISIREQRKTDIQRHS